MKWRTGASRFSVTSDRGFSTAVVHSNVLHASVNVTPAV